MSFILVDKELLAKCKNVICFIKKNDYLQWKEIVMALLAVLLHKLVKECDLIFTEVTITIKNSKQ